MSATIVKDFSLLATSSVSIMYFIACVQTTRQNTQPDNALQLAGKVVRMYQVLVACMQARGKHTTTTITTHKKEATENNPRKTQTKIQTGVEKKRR